VHSVVFTPAARFELMDAQNWYEDEMPGLGARFLAEVSALIERMQENPQQFPVVHRNIRRALLRHFPYALMFVIGQDERLTVLACFHGSRDPLHWQKRS
jgi:plasmid stabilization system protein ParE